MATRQYIGARYVPKFYDFNGSTEWRSGVEYEPLTIVTRNGNSYTSKIPVPSSVTEPENNPHYWVATGLYNDQVESIRLTAEDAIERVEELEKTVDIIDENYPFLDKTTAFGIYSHPWIVDGNSISYAQQVSCFTNLYLILSGSSVEPANTKNCLYVLNKNTLDPVNLAIGNPVFIEFDSTTTPTSSHAVSLVFDSENNEVYLATGTDSIAIVFDAVTLAEKRRVVLPENGPCDYDSISRTWCFRGYSADRQTYLFNIYDQNFTFIKTITANRPVEYIEQGLTYTGTLIISCKTAPTALAGNANVYTRSQGITIYDMNGDMVKEWWMSNIYEIENAVFTSDTEMMITSCNNGYIELFTMRVKPSNQGATNPWDFLPCRYQIPSGTGTHINSVSFVQRSGDIGVLFINTLKDIESAWTEVATLPQGFRPLYLVECDFMSPSGTAFFGRIRITTDGVISALTYGEHTGAINCRINLTYVCR